MGEKDFSDRTLAPDAALSFVPAAAFAAVRQGVADPLARAAVLADLCRLNTLYMIMRAGSGHIGSSFSSTDVITWLWTETLRDPNGPSADADIYFSSKGHDAPALYSLLIALGKLDFDLLHRLRQIDGLPGHPDVSTPFIATNTGSLGMGISKAYGMARGLTAARGATLVEVEANTGATGWGEAWGP
ncbi:MAG: transketolase, partial [Vicinamibacteria bacterium]